MNSNKNIEYLNLEYLKSKVGIIGSITVHNVDAFRNILNAEIDEIIKASFKIDLLVVDMYKTPAKYSDVRVAKESNLKKLFIDIEANDAITNILFVNNINDPLTDNFLIEKDFPDSNKIFVTSFVRKKENADDYDDVFLCHSKNVPYKEIEDVSTRVFGTDSTSGHKEKYIQFISSIVSNRIKTILLENRCIEPIEEKDHILSSTPVHVNRYVNLKPVLEKHDFFNEVCCLLYHQIERVCGTPDFVVASSRNSIFIASGLLKYFEHANMIIIDQISPVTKLTNFSNLDDIKPNRKYAIIEDFYCMGTEIKIVKSVLWSRGVDVDDEQYPIHVFPIVSSNLYGDSTAEQFMKKKIHPLHILDNSDESEKYLMFTSSCCPVCNGIECEHSKAFNFKKRDCYESI